MEYHNYLAFLLKLLNLEFQVENIASMVIFGVAGGVMLYLVSQ